MHAGFVDGGIGRETIKNEDGSCTDERVDDCEPTLLLVPVPVISSLFPELPSGDRPGDSPRFYFEPISHIDIGSGGDALRIATLPSDLT